MLVRFPICRDEAVGRMKSAVGHLDYIGESALSFHETPVDWAKTISYGKDERMASPPLQEGSRDRSTNRHGEGPRVSAPA
ncbi:MAG TPA: hypothetical protein VHN18_19655 [Micromonosporaceae bacterium]|nr:hypothetical protein [Micromonosporaceae bacterium]